jgi:hypothetical protein
MDITATQLEALQQYAVWAGPMWKRKLSTDWMRGGSRWPGPWAPLQQLRNELGPKWLANYELPEQDDE